MFPFVIVILAVPILLGLTVLVAGALPLGTETHTLSIRDFPNVAADISAPRDTVVHP